MTATITKLVLLVIAFAPPASQRKRVPAVLEKAFRQRTNFGTAYFKYKWVSRWPDLAERTNFYEARFAGEDIYLIDHGDEDGIRQWDYGTGEPGLGVRNTCLPQKLLFNRKAEQWWVLSGSYHHVGRTVRIGGPPMSDVRTFGVYSQYHQYKSPEEALAAFRNADAAWHDEERAGLHLVRAIREDSKERHGHFEAEWEIDPSRDYAITRVTTEWVQTDGSKRTASETTSEYMQVDGRWWPRKSEILCPNSGRYCSVEYERAEFDRPDHPQQLDPEALGLAPGVEIVGQEFRDMDPPNGRYIGQGVVLPESEWRKIRDQYDLAPRRAFYAAQDALGRGYFPAWWDAPDDTFGLKDVQYQPDAWEAWVRRWIIKHTSSQFHPVVHPVDGKQRHTAWAILKESRQRADPIRRRIDEELRKIDRVLRATGADPTAPDRSAGKKTGDSAVVATGRLAAARKRREELEHPKAVEAIFTQLKRRLDGLLTSGQRQAEAPTGDAPLSKPRR